MSAIGRRVHRLALIIGLAVGGLCLFSPAPVHATEDEAMERATEAGAHPGGELPKHETPTIHPTKLALQFLNFAVLVFILAKFGGPAINKALRARHEQLKADLAAAASARAEAEARLARQEARLGALEQEIAAIQSGVKQEAEAEKARLIALAEERAKRIREETTFALDQQVKEAEASLRREVAQAAVALAEQLVKKSMNPADQQRMVDAFVADVAKPGATGRAV